MTDTTGLRLLLAARKSGKVQTSDGQGISIHTQDKRGRAWAESHGHTVVAVAADIRSGTVAPWDRPNLRPWVTDAALMTQYDGILAFKNDRLSRGCWSDEARIRMWAEENRKVLIIVDGPQWPPRHDGDSWSWEAMAKQARKEWEEIRERSVRAQDELRERQMLVGKPPWGYTSSGEKYHRQLTPTELGKRYIPEIFARVIAGESLAAICRWLTAEGVPATGIKGQTTTGWWPGTLAQMIRNPVYMGRRCEQDPKTREYGKTLHTCPPLVDAATFRRAGKALDSRPKRGPMNNGNAAMLKGALSCGCEDCTAGPDSPMYRIRSFDGFAYRCTGRGSQRKGCGNMVSMDRVNDAVNEIIAETFGTPVMIRTVVPGNGDELNAKLDDIRYSIKQLGDRELSDDEYDAELARLRGERQTVENTERFPDHVEETPTGDTYAALYANLSEPERGPWLVSHGFRVTASRTLVTVSQGDVTASREL